MARKSGFVRGESTYKKVPDTLMGFKKQPPDKPFTERAGKEFRVLVEHEGQPAFKDAVKGRNPQHALEVATRNWPGAKVRVTNLVRGVGGAVLSPAGLAEDVAGAVARRAYNPDEDLDKAIARPRLTKPVRRSRS